MNVTVAGAGGMIGGHLVGALLADGHYVRAVDIKPIEEWWQVHRNNIRCENGPSLDLSDSTLAGASVYGMDQVYDLAENMGGIGYITKNKVACAESITIGINLLRAAERCKLDRFFFSSSACVYNTT